MTQHSLKELYKRIQEQAVHLARNDIKAFSVVMNPDYSVEWFQKIVYKYLDQWQRKEIKKLAIFMPPQHGKSTMSSIINPAHILGRKPSAKIVCASYTQTVASNFNRACQDIISSKAYREVFPNTRIPNKNEDSDNELKNSTYFETIGEKGFYMSVGVGGSLTGTTIEYGIIDDPIKDRKEANSITYRNNLWHWYTDVWSTRMNEGSCEMMLFTRWHEDDLAGRIFDPTNKHYDPIRASEWTVLVLPALKEDAPPPIKQAIEIEDPREIGEALWENMHSRKSHEDDKRNNPYTFASLKQQRPSPLEGGLLKKEWFPIINESELPFQPENVPVHFIIDGAFTDKTSNDPTAQMAYYVYNGEVYIKNCMPMHLNLDKYLPFARRYFNQHDYDDRSLIRIENKASGPALLSMLKQPEYGGFNVAKVNEKFVSYGKLTRGEYATPALASGKVHLIKGSWNEAFIKQCITFPNDVNDDMYDCLCYAILHEIHKVGKRTIKTNVKLSTKIN